jgi:hypothetical protein
MSNKENIEDDVAIPFIVYNEKNGFSINPEA